MSKEKIIAALQEIVASLMRMQRALGAGNITFIDKELPKHKENPKVGKQVQEQNEREYRISKNPCKTCGMYISWDGYDKNNPTPPIHVDSAGHMVGDGRCPEF